MHQCLTIAATTYRAVRISLPSICWNGARTCSSGTSRPYVKRCGALGPSAHFTSTAGWFCRITSIACSPCQPVTMTFPTASKPSRSGSAGGGTERAALIGAYSPRRTGDMATSFLGTRPSRRRRLCAPHGLCTLQFSQTWPCYAVAQWPYSTFHRWVKAGVYPVGWGGDGVTDVPAGERT